MASVAASKALENISDVVVQRRPSEQQLPGLVVVIQAPSSPRPAAAPLTIEPDAERLPLTE